jgi:cytoskeletal protein RodZ
VAEAEPRQGGGRWLKIGLAVALAGVVVLGLAGAGIWYFVLRAPPDLGAVVPAGTPEVTTPAEAPQAPTDAEAVAEAAPAPAEEEEEEDDAPARPSRTPRSTRSSTPPPATTRSSGSTTARSTEPSAPAAAPAEVTPNPAEEVTGAAYNASFTVQGKQAKIICGDGQSREFVGTTRLEFRGVVTCRIEASGARTAVPVRRASSWNCTLEGTTLTCQER